MILPLAARLTVVAVLAYSGLSKLGSDRTASAAEDLGLSRGFAKIVGRWLAPLELLVAGLLFFSLTARVGALLALVLFISFTVLVAWNLWQGKKPACACFGEASAEAISNWTLGRNSLLIGLAGLLAFGSGPGPRVGVLGELALTLEAFGPFFAIAVLLLAQVAILLALLWKSGAPSAAPAPGPGAAVSAPEAKGWPPGTLAPSFDLPALTGGRVTLRDLVGRGRNTVLFFTSPNCRHCTALFPEIARWQDEYSGTLSVALISRGAAAANRQKAEDFGVRDLLLQGGSEVAEAYQALATPTAVVVDRDRRIVSRLAIGAVEIRNLVAAWADRSESGAPAAVLSPPPPDDPSVLLVGDPAPPFKLAAVRGGDVDLFDFSGRLTVLVFWSPTCPHCRRFAPDLKERERAQSEDSAPMVFLASGTREANEAMGLASPILLDEERSVMKAYGVKGTPTAVLVDADGKVGSVAAVGSVEIQALFSRADLMARMARRIQA